MARYFTNVGPLQGPYHGQNASSAIEVFELPTAQNAIGVAVPVGSYGGGMTLWRLIVRGHIVPELWLVIDRQFVPAKDESR